MVDRRVMKKMENLKLFRQYLIALTESGDITRQEAVSMIPPLMLDVKSCHFVLDMCAAPGSKTSQLVELIQEKHIYEKTLPLGVVVANDVDEKRARTLVHQCKRSESPCMVITCAKGQDIPNDVLFDRVLCDAPCSGDGTLRKNPEIWTKWKMQNGMGLHTLQIDIAMNGVKVLKVGGKMVYSTCSFNPIENEAVVAELLRRTNGAVRIMDASTCLPKLKRRKGLTTWKVIVAFFKIFEKNSWMN